MWSVNVRVNELLFFSFCPVTTPCKGEAANLSVVAKSWYKKNVYIYMYMYEYMYRVSQKNVYLFLNAYKIIYNGRNFKRFVLFEA